MGAEFEGFDELERELEALAERAEALEGEQEVPLNELLPSSFLKAHSRFRSLEQLLEESQWEVETEEDFEAIPDDEWDAFIASNTDFSDWEAMLGVAAQEWAARQLGLKE